jgi:hypothetical protein
MENLHDELNDYKNINHQAYKNNANDSDHRQTGLDWFNSQMLRLVPQKYNPESERNEQIGDWDKVGGSRHVGVYQNKKTGEIHQAISGSRTLKDFFADGMMMLGYKNAHYNKRKEEAVEMALRIQRLKNASGQHLKHSISGHSLGSNISNELIHKGMGDKGVNFNPFVTRHDAHKADHHKILNVRNKGDFASYRTRNFSNTVNLDGPNNKIYDVRNHSLGKIKI